MIKSLTFAMLDHAKPKYILFQKHCRSRSADFQRPVDQTTVKPVLSGHSKKDKTKILMTNGSLMKVESIAECSPWNILLYF